MRNEERCVNNAREVMNFTRLREVLELRYQKPYQRQLSSSRSRNTEYAQQVKTCKQDDVLMNFYPLHG